MIEVLFFQADLSASGGESGIYLYARDTILKVYLQTSENAAPHRAGEKIFFL